MNTTASFRLKSGDNVVVVTGRDKGKQGKIKKVYRNAGKVLVEGINQVKKHIRATQQNPQGGIDIKELPLEASNVMLLDPKTNKPTRIGRKQIDVKGKKKWVRFAKKSGELLDK